jgi:hypothetical protein
MAMHHIVVLIDQARWRGAHFISRHFTELQEFDATDDGLVECLRWCEQFPQADISFLTNLADEHYHVETLPHVRGSTGRQLLMRKLSAWPFAQGMHAIVRLDSVQALRRENRFLFASLVHPPLSSWLSRLANTSRIQGVYTQALAMPYWLPVLAKNMMNRLYVQCTQQQVRISYFQRQRLFFSRLIALPQHTFPDLDGWLGRIAQEAGQIRKLLIQQRWIQEAEVLQVTWLGQVPQDISLLKKHLPSNSVWTCISMVELMRHLGFKQLPEGMDVMDLAAIQALLHGDALPNLAPAEALLPNRMMRTKRYLHWAGAVMTGLMLLAGYAGMQATQHTWFKVQQLNHQWSGVQSVTTKSGIALAQLPQVRTLTQSVQAFESSALMPERALTILQQAVSGMSAWQLVNLEWRCPSPAALADLTNDATTKPLLACQQTLIARWSAVAMDNQATMEWQQLLNQLRSQAEVERVEVVSSPDAGSASRRGGTRQTPPKEPELTLYLRPIGKAPDS